MEEECSASHAERDYAQANLERLQASLVEAKDGAHISQQIVKEEETTGVKGQLHHTAMPSCRQSQVRSVVSMLMGRLAYPLTHSPAGRPLLSKIIRNSIRVSVGAQ